MFVKLWTVVLQRHHGVGWWHRIELIIESSRRGHVTWKLVFFLGNGLPPVRLPAITWPIADLLSFGPRTYLSETLFFPFKKMYLRVLYAKCWLFYSCFNMLTPLKCCDISPAIWQCGLVTWWRHQMETFTALLAICAGNSPVTGEFPAQRPVTRSL